MPTVHYATEGVVDAAVAKRLIAHFGGEVGRFSLSCGGKIALDRSLPKFAEAANFGVPRLVFRDLDNDSPCAGGLVGKLIGQVPSHVCLRIAVREIESWLLADAEGFCRAVPAFRAKDIPSATDELTDPKRFILDAVRSRGSRSLKRQMLSRDRHQAFAGPEYSAVLQHFAANDWSIARAETSRRSQSLCRSMQRIREFINSFS